MPADAPSYKNNVVEKLSSKDKEECEMVEDALIKAGQRNEAMEALKTATGDVKKKLEEILGAIDTSAQSKELLKKHLKVSAEKIRELYPETSARYFGHVRFFWVDDDILKWPRGFFVDGDKVVQVSHGCKELIPIVEGRMLDAKMPIRSRRVLNLLAATWFGNGYESNKVGMGKNIWSLSWGDFAVQLTTDETGKITRAYFMIW